MGEIDEEHRFVRRAEDPDGRMFCIEGVTAFVVSGPVVFGGPRLARLLARVQRPRTHPACHLEVSRENDDEVLLDESLDDMDEGRRRAEVLVAQIQAGAFL